MAVLVCRGWCGTPVVTSRPKHSCRALGRHKFHNLGWAGACGRVRQVSASLAEGRQFDPGQGAGDGVDGGEEDGESMVRGESAGNFANGWLEVQPTVRTVSSSRPLVRRGWSLGGCPCGRLACAHWLAAARALRRGLTPWPQDNRCLPTLGMQCLPSMQELQPRSDRVRPVEAFQRSMFCDV